MNTSSFRVAWVALLAPAALFAQNVTTSGSLTVGGGAALLDGDRPSFQSLTQHRKDGYGGIEEFRLTRESRESLFTFNARLLPGDDDYRLAVRFEKPERFYATAGFEEYRVFYDGSAGYFRPSATEFTLFDEDLSLKRGKIWAELGLYLADQTLFRLRYERQTRDGRKGSTHWADSALVGTFGTRNVVPAFYDFDETTDVFTLDVGNEAREEVKWNVGARYQETELDNKRWTRRRPFETADRQVTHTDQTKTDIFSAHGYYQRKVNEQLTISAGALRTDLDANLAGSRIYGQTFDPVYDPAYVRRQQRDEGFYALTGEGELKQTVLNLNAVYVPKKDWSVRPSVRFENLHQETLAEFVETNIGAGPAFAAIIEEAEGFHSKKWDEFSGEVELRYTGKPNWTFSGEALWIQGSGDLEEERIVHHTTVTVDRHMDNERTSQKYSLKANWYPKPGVSFAAQYYFKVNVNDYDAVRDNTPPGTSDRYPAFITDQDFETHDINFRLAWRPVSSVSLITRYDHQQSLIVSQEAGLEKARSSKYRSHIFSQSATWSATGRLFVTGNVNVTYDQLETPAYAFITHGDNNYVTGSIGGGYALAKLDDLYFDYSWFRASNFIDNSAINLPYGASQKQQAASLTWVRRQSENLIYTFKYGYVTNRDGTWAGRNDFDAHVFYARVQYHF